MGWKIILKWENKVLIAEEAGFNRNFNLSVIAWISIEYKKVTVEGEKKA